MRTIMLATEVSERGAPHQELDTILNLTKIKGTRSPVNNRMGFKGYIHTDGFSISVSFTKEIVPDSHVSLPSLEANDLEEWELKFLKTWGVDPGVTSVYVASNGSEFAVYGPDIPAQDPAQDPNIDPVAEPASISPVEDPFIDPLVGHAQSLSVSPPPVLASHEIWQLSSAEYYTKAEFQLILLLIEQSIWMVSPIIS
ncbi:hypothetical protein BC941DRAFT_182981 [Chlamydoabsidia padenii]|nr:hypothetical protein BC941DRAFT_182981 [Chlamydoabsidia padenii]